MSDAYQEFGYGPAGHYETIHSKARPASQLDAQTSSAWPRCVKWGCNKVKLEWLEKGRSLQTRNGFFTAHFDQWMCPTCGAGYGDGQPVGRPPSSLAAPHGSATALAAKVEALEKLVIELTLISISTATIKHHHKDRLDHLLGDLHYAGVESPNAEVSRAAEQPKT